MFTINRSLVVLRPQQPFIDWVTSLLEPNPVGVEEVLADTTSMPRYLAAGLDNRSSDLTMAA